MRLQRRQRLLRERRDLGIGAALGLRAELRDLGLMVANHLAQERRIEFVARQFLQRFELPLLLGRELARRRNADLVGEAAGPL